MNIWLDAQLSPAIARWISERFDVNAAALRELGLRDSTDRDVFLAARDRGAIVMTKDEDFVRLLEELGAPPQIIWVTCGNTSNARLKVVLTKAGDEAFALLKRGEPLVEISGK
jgi:predicted nuclease of predicted toxin-antitoxin system